MWGTLAYSEMVAVPVEHKFVRDAIVRVEYMKGPGRVYEESR